MARPISLKAWNLLVIVVLTRTSGNTSSTGSTDSKESGTSSSASTSADITLLSQGESSDLRTLFNVYVTLVSTAWQSTPSLSESSRKLLAMRHVGSEVVDATIISGSKILVMPAKRSSCSWIQGRKAASGEGGGGASWQGDMPGGWLPI